MLDVVEKVEVLLGKKAEIQWQEEAPADVRATWADIDKALELLNWAPETTLEEGLESCVNWYLQEQSWARDVHTLDE